jgi:hypothetical protein
MVTANQREFERVPNLQTENWRQQWVGMNLLTQQFPSKEQAPSKK